MVYVEVHGTVKKVNFIGNETHNMHINTHSEDPMASKISFVYLA